MSHSRGHFTVEASTVADGSPAAPARRGPGNGAWRAEELVAPRAFTTIEFEADADLGALWCRMRASERPSFTPDVLADMSRAQAVVKARLAASSGNAAGSFRYLVLGSRTPGIYNLGGDLALFEASIRRGDREELTRYAHRCADIVFNSADGYGCGLTTIALVQGQALGGGFEAALSCHLIVAERGARFGLPEVLFNLFPGMGAYSFLSRRLGPAAAERMILGGRVHTAAELHALGVVDVLAEDGKGEEAVRRLVREHDRRSNARHAMRAVRQRLHPLTREELIGVTDLWVDAALRLTNDDLRRMRRLVAAQARRGDGPDARVAAAE